MSEIKLPLHLNDHITFTVSQQWQNFTLLWLVVLCWKVNTEQKRTTIRTSS